MRQNVSLNKSMEEFAVHHRIMTQGFYWPMMKQEFKLFIKRYETYQKFGNIIHAPTTTLYSLSSPWPLYKWGIDIVGMLP